MQIGACVSIKRIFFIFVLCFSRLSFAELEIIDQGNQLQTLPPYRQGTEFASAYTCGKPTPFFVKTGTCKVHCEFGMCEEQCAWPEVVTANFQPEECTADHVSIYSRGNTIDATASDYKASSNSMALTIIKAMPLFYEDIQKVRVDQVLFPVRKNFIENGEMKTVMLTVIVLSIFPDKTKDESQGLMLSMDLQQSGLNQVMCLAPHGSCDSNQEYFLKRKGLVNAIK